MKVIRPDSKNKERDVDICIAVAKTKNYKVVADHYGLTKMRVAQIFRIYMANLCEQMYGIPYLAAVKNKGHYFRKDALDLLYTYKNWLLINNCDTTGHQCEVMPDTGALKCVNCAKIMGGIHAQESQ